MSLAQGDAPEFDEFTKNLVTTARDYGTSKMKVAARIMYPTKANWKLALENFQECYHCRPAHKSLVKAHPFWDGLMSQEQRTRLERLLDTNAAPVAPTSPRCGTSR